MKSLQILILIVVLCSKGYGEILNVPEQFDTIQLGINAAENGDTVLVAPGEYVENLSIAEKIITLSSWIIVNGDPDFIESTIINGGRNGSAITLSDRCDTTLVRGFTIRNGLANFGGGIICVFADIFDEDLNPKLEDLIIVDNEAEILGGGIYAKGVNNLKLNRVKILNNRAGESGGGVNLWVCWRVNIDDCSFQNNVAGGDGGGLWTQAYVYMNRVLIANNSSGQSGGGLYFRTGAAALNQLTVTSNSAAEEACGGIVFDCRNADGDSSVGLNNSIIYGNTGHQAEVIWSSFDQVTLKYSDIQGGREAIVLDGCEGEDQWGEGNIDANPLFVDPGNGDFNLTIDSPCIDTGDPDSELDADGTRADMGALHYHQRDIAVDPLELIFPPVGIGQLDSLAVIITNDGLTDLTILRIMGCRHWSCFWVREERQEDWQPFVIEPMQSYQLWVFCEPEEGAGFERTFFISSDDPDESEILIEVTGEPNEMGDSEPAIPLFYSLNPPYPNPFNSKTTLTYDLPVTSEVALKVFNINGHLVEVLQDQVIEAGQHSVIWDANTSSVGLYFLQMKSNDVSSVRKVVLVK